MKLINRFLTGTLLLFAVFSYTNVNAQYSVEQLLGSKALGLLQFNDPRAVVSDDQGFIYVGDQMMLYKISAQGEVIHKYGPTNYMNSIALDSEQNIIVAYSDHVARLTPEFSLINELAFYGQGENNTNGIIGMGIDGANNIYTLDLVPADENKIEYRVKVFSPEGNFLGQIISLIGGNIGTEGNFLYSLVNQIAVNNQHVALSIFNYGNGDNIGLINTYTLDGTFLNEIGSRLPAENLINFPVGLSFSRSGDILISSYAQLIRYSVDGSFISAFPLPDASVGNQGTTIYPVDIMEESNGDLLIADAGLKNIIERITSNGEVLAKYGTGNGPGQFNLPSDVAKDSNGNLYVLDTYNFRVQKFDAAGNFLFQFGDKGGNSAFISGTRLKVDQDNNVYVLATPKIFKYDQEGNYLLSFGESGVGDGKFNYATDFYIDTESNLYVLNMDFNFVSTNIQKFNANGEFLSKFGISGTGEGQLNYANSIAVDHKGFIYINDYNSATGYYRTQKFSNAGEYIKALPINNYFPEIELDEYGNLYAIGYNYINRIAESGETTVVFEGTAETSFTYGGLFIEPTSEKIIFTDIVNNNVIKLSCSKPKPLFSVVPGLANAVTYFTDESTEVSPSASYKWEFGDGAVLNYNGSVDHTYQETKEYEASLTIDQGCLTRMSKTFNLVTSLESDRLSLTDFFNQSNGNNWTNNSNWLTPDVATWNGVTITNGRVTGLEINSNNVQGVLPASMSQLDKLNRLVLSNNNISQELPAWIGKLTNLNQLVLSNNQIHGAIPTSIDHLTNLTTLDLSKNQLTESIPASLSHLTSLTSLDLSSNKLSNEIPASLLNLTNIVTINLSNNSLTKLPNFSSIASVRALAVENNQLSFGDLEPNMGIESFSYSPQPNLAAPQSAITFYLGGNLSLSMTVPGNSNQYQWYKNAQPISGATTASYHASSITAGDAGSYFLQITNTLVNDLVLRSSDIAVSVVTPPDNDGDGFTVLNDCDDIDPTVHPGAEELCDGKDNNCDGLIDNNCASAQIWGLTTFGGPGNSGTIFSVYADIPNSLQLQHSFFSDLEDPFYGGLLELPDGSMVGLAGSGSGYRLGGIFKISKDGTEQVIHAFNSSDGAYPHGSLILGSDGKLYGLAAGGGPGGLGSIFKIDQDGKNFTVIHGFNGPDGGDPFGSLLQAADGQLYGMTRDGGSMGLGTVFKVDTDGSNFAVLHNLNSADGAQPYGSLIQSPDGSILGMTSTGGSFEQGTIFKMTLDGSNYSVLHHFDGIGGSTPNGSLLRASNGLLYGMTSGGGNINHGTVFKINTDGSGYEVIHHFNSTNGSYPLGSLMQAPDEGLFGLTMSGGYGYGTVFKIDPDGANQTVLHSFTYTDGANPQGSLIKGSDQHLYGMTLSGGSKNLGTVFQISMDGSGFNSIYSFGRSEGTWPSGALVKTPDGSVFGITANGGDNQSGTIFKINNTGSGFTTVHNFEWNKGSIPNGGLIVASDGYLYGTTRNGGDFGAGTLYRLNPDGTNHTVLYRFNGADGSEPYGSLIQAPNGHLYGTTHYGGSVNYGTIFKINTDGTGYKVITDFQDNLKGYYPAGSLFLAANGFIYGMTQQGGSSGWGTLFKIDEDESALTVIHNFNASEGRYPTGSLAQSPDGTLYGTASFGGPDDQGSIFKIKPDGTGFTVLKYFNNRNGSMPGGTLIFYHNKLFGSTTYGGQYNEGTVFSFDLSTSTLTKLADLNDFTGKNPQLGGLLLVNATNILKPNQASSDISFSNVTNQAMTISFQPGNGKKRVVLMAEGSPSNPVTIGDGTELVGNSNYTSATEYQTGWKIVYVGDLSSVNITGLIGDTNYTVTVIEYNGSVTETVYLNEGAPLASQRTMPDVIRPTIPASNISFSNVTPTSMTVTFAGGNGMYHMAVMKKDYSVDFVPVDNTFYSGSINGNLILSGYTNYSIEVLDLEPNTNYYFKIYEYNTNWDKVLYLIDNAPVASQRTMVMPNVQVITPANGVSGQNPNDLLVIANRVDKARTYTIELSTDTHFNYNVISKTGSRSQKFTGLEYNTIYYARVKTDLSQYYGKVTSFSTAPAYEYAYVINPADKATGISTTVTVSSNPVERAGGYIIELNTSNNFDGISFSQSGGPDMLFSGLSPKTTYYARVMTNLSWGLWGKTTSFTTGSKTKSAGRDGLTSEGDEEDIVFNINIKENPFKQRLSFIVSTPVEEDVTIKLSDLTGKSIIQLSEKTNKSVEIDKPIVAGVYLLHVNTNSGSKVVRVIKVD